jgi:hypothetical protein
MSQNPGLVEALAPVAEVLQAMQIKFYIGGSVASSFHGASRSTMDVDLIADLRAKDVEEFVTPLRNEYYVSKAAINDAIARLSCFNLIHLPSSFKVDIFVLKGRPFDINAMNRAALGTIDLKSDVEFPIASPEDTILSKLEWYRLGNEVSERQWDDVVRVLNVVGEKADRDYMLRNADDLNVADLLQKLLKAVS